MAIPFVGKRYSLEEFEAYLATLKFSSFKPVGVTIHHTWNPNLENRPNGLEPKHLQSLKHYYEVSMQWKGAPHIFLDDQEKGIIVFQRLDRRGVHAFSFNRNYWGLEMLGNFDNPKELNSDRGKKIMDLAAATTLAMLAFLQLNPTEKTVNFHRHDPKTTKSCPGNWVNYGTFLSKVQQANKEAVATKEYLVTFQGKNVPTHNVNGRPAVKLRSFLDTFGYKFNVQFQKADPISNSILRISELDIPLAELDAKGAAWVYLRDLANLLNLSLTFTGANTIELKLPTSI